MITPPWVDSVRAQVICTLAMPFLVFYLAETAWAPTMQMSGVLAVVCYGLVFASPYGKVRIDPGVEHFLHEFWGMVGHLVNTIVFVLSGIIIVIMIDWRSPTLGSDIGLGVAAYALMGVYRAAVMFGVMPLFRRGHYGYSWKDALVITWGGLRGAVGLALAISVFLDTSITDAGVLPPGESSCGRRLATASASASGSTSGSGDGCDDAAGHYRNVVLLHTSMIVVLTLVVNAPSSAPILKTIGLTKLSNTRVSMLQLSLKLLTEKCHATLRGLVAHPVHSDVCWKRVQALANFDEMAADILGQNYAFDAAVAWAPGSQGDAADDDHASGHGHGGHGAGGNSHAHGKATEKVAGRTPAAEALSPARVAAAEANLRRLGNKLSAAMNLAGADFVTDFKRRLEEKRLHEAKYRLLEAIKSSVWGMYEHGQLRASSAQHLKALVMDQIDALEANQEVEVNPLPFEPLQAAIRARPAVLKLAHCFESLDNQTVLLGPLARYANTLTFREFERGYDVTLGYLLAHEEVLASHDHGHAFSLDKALDRRFKDAVQANIDEALKQIATLRLSWPKLCTALNTTKAARLVLNAGESLVGELGHHGVLHETESGRLLDAIAAAKSRLHTLSPLLALPPEERLDFFPDDAGKMYTDAEVAAEQAKIFKRRKSKTEASKKLSMASKSMKLVSMLSAKTTTKVTPVDASMVEDGAAVEATPEQESALEVSALP